METVNVQKGSETVVEIKQTIRYIAGADTAVLFVHGILGTPEHFAQLLPFVPSNWSIYNILLKGHGGGVEDFSAASMAEWKQQVHDAFQALRAAHGRVIFVAHSMGTLFAIQEAINDPGTVLFLMNPPLTVRLRFQMLKTSWRVFWGKIKPDDAWSLAAQQAYGIEQDTHIFRYLGWIPRYLELFSEIRKTRKLLDKLSVPCQAYLSRKDEMVSPRSGKFFEGNPCVTVKMLNTSGHFYYSPEDQQLLQHDFCHMIQNIKTHSRKS